MAFPSLGLITFTHPQGRIVRGITDLSNCFTQYLDPLPLQVQPGRLTSPSLVLGICVLLLGTILYAVNRKKPSSPPKGLQSQRLYALSKLFTVSASPNSPFYASLLPSVDSQQKQIKGSEHIRLKLTPFLDAIRNGHLEIHNIDALVLLFRCPDRLAVPGTQWTFSLATEFVWWTRTTLWMIRTELEPIPKDAVSQTHEIDLDYIPAQRMSTYLRKVIEHNHDSSLVLKMSCVAPGVGPFSREFVWAALPFLRSSLTDCSPLSSTPFVLSVQELITLVEEGGKDLVSEMTNVTSDAITDLLTQQTSLEIERSQRKACIEAIGLEGWREKRCMLAWRAAALKAGVLQRWKIVLRKRDHAVVS